MTQRRKRPTDYGRAVGQLIGKNLMQNRALQRIIPPYFKKDRKLPDAYGILHEIDFVDDEQEPTILIDSKYIKGQRHAREKANEILTKLTLISEAHPSVKLLIAVLAGAFTDDSKRTLSDRGIHVLHIPLKILARNLRKYGLIIDWANKDRRTPRETWERYVSMSDEELDKIAEHFFDGTNIPDKLKKLIQKSRTSTS